MRLFGQHYHKQYVYFKKMNISNFAAYGKSIINLSSSKSNNTRLLLHFSKYAVDFFSRFEYDKNKKIIIQISDDIEINENTIKSYFDLEINYKLSPYIFVVYHPDSFDNGKLVNNRLIFKFKMELEEPKIICDILGHDYLINNDKIYNATCKRCGKKEKLSVEQIKEVNILKRERKLERIIYEN